MKKYATFKLHFENSCGKTRFNGDEHLCFNERLVYFEARFEE